MKNGLSDYPFHVFEQQLHNQINVGLNSSHHSHMRMVSVKCAALDGFFILAHDGKPGVLSCTISNKAFTNIIQIMDLVSIFVSFTIALMIVAQYSVLKYIEPKPCMILIIYTPVFFMSMYILEMYHSPRLTRTVP